MVHLMMQILQLLSHIEPLALFSDWSPPRQLSKAQVDPVRIVSSSDFDSLHCAQRYGSATCPPMCHGWNNHWI